MSKSYQESQNLKILSKFPPQIIFPTIFNRFLMRPSLTLLANNFFKMMQDVEHPTPELQLQLQLFLFFWILEYILKFDKNLLHREVHGTCREALPVGMDVTLDARRAYVAKVKEIHYQAFIVLADSHSASPFPTLLMGGLGSMAPSAVMPPGSTFYYLDLSLAVKLSAQIEAIQSIHREHPSMEYFNGPRKSTTKKPSQEIIGGAGSSVEAR